MKHKAATQKRHYIKSSSFIMVIIFTILCGLISLSLGYFINFFAKGHFVESTEIVLDTQFELIKLHQEYEPNYKADTNKDNTFIYKINNINTEFAILKGVETDIFSKDILIFTNPADSKKYAARIYRLNDTKNILVGFDITDIARDFDLMQIMGISSIIFVLMVVSISYIISIFVVRGTNNIAETAYNIMETGDLSKRISFKSRWDDLGNIIGILNALLARIQKLLTSLQRFSDNIAHDLRTPLTRLHHRLSELKYQYNDDAHSKLVEESANLIHTFDSLLRISRIEHEQRRHHFANIDLHHILHDIIDFYEPVMEEKNIALSTNIAPITLHGDKHLLFQAFANIIDNAIEYSPDGGFITIEAIQENAHIIITIQDGAGGVHPHNITNIFERFFREDESRSKKQGNGLGLSLVKAIITLHGGMVEARNTEHGLAIITKI